MSFLNHHVSEETQEKIDDMLDNKPLGKKLHNICYDKSLDIISFGDRTQFLKGLSLKSESKDRLILSEVSKLCEKTNVRDNIHNTIIKSSTIRANIAPDVLKILRDDARTNLSSITNSILTIASQNEKEKLAQIFINVLSIANQAQRKLCPAEITFNTLKDLSLPFVEHGIITADELDDFVKNIILVSIHSNTNQNVHLTLISAAALAAIAASIATSASSGFKLEDINKYAKDSFERITGAVGSLKEHKDSYKHLNDYLTNTGDSLNSFTNRVDDIINRIISDISGSDNKKSIEYQKIKTNMVLNHGEIRKNLLTSAIAAKGDHINNEIKARYTEEIVHLLNKIINNSKDNYYSDKTNMLVNDITSHLHNIREQVNALFSFLYESKSSTSALKIKARNLEKLFQNLESECEKSNNNAGELTKACESLKDYIENIGNISEEDKMSLMLSKFVESGN